jgi:hypothetical protein
VPSMEAFQRAVAPALQAELPTMLAMTSNPNPSMGEECRKADLDTTMWEGVRNMDLKASRILSEEVVISWKVHWLWEILPMTSRVPTYFENRVT